MVPSMEPSSKRIRAAEDPSGDQLMEPPSNQIRAAGNDRLSDLPDCLIHSVLSFLESRQVVRSSVLSRRWRHLWRSVPCIDIDLTVFRRQAHCQDPKCCKTDYIRILEKEWRLLEMFGNNLLMLHNAPSLDKVRIHVPTLNFTDKQAIRPFLGWISRGVQCSPAVIDIHMDFNWSWANWGRSNNYGPFPDLGSSSSRLTRLLLHGVKIDESFAEQLRSRLPVLEDLSLNMCFCNFGNIVSGSLRHLSIVDCVNDHYQLFQAIVVTAPRLTSMRTSFSTKWWPNGIYSTHTVSFVKASVCLVYTLSQMSAGFCEKLCNIFNVRHLELFGARMMDEMQCITNILPKFHNVRTLLIDGCCLKTSAHIQALDRFLQSTPGLEKLTLQNCEFSECSKRRTARAKWRKVPLESQNLMSFKCDNLEVIEIKHSKDDNVDALFELFMGLWRNLGKTNIKLTKV